MIGQFTGHRRRTGLSPVFLFGEFLMDEAKIVRAANEIHPRVQAVQAGCSVPTLAGQARQPFATGPVEAFDKRGIENLSSTRRRQQLLGPLHDPVSHSAGTLHDALLLGALDHRPNVPVWPHSQARSPRSRRELDLLAKRSSNAARIRAPAVCQHKEWAQALRGAADLAESCIGQPLVSAQAHRSGHPESR